MEHDLAALEPGLDVLGVLAQYASIDRLRLGGIAPEIRAPGLKQPAASTVDRSGTRPTKEAETVVACTPLTVSAPGYVDVVIRDYMKAQPIQ